MPGGTKAVTFRGVPGAKVRTLENSASNVTFQGIEVDAGFATTAGFQNHGADHVTFRDAAIGNVSDEKGALVSGSHFTFDNVVFHDAIMTPGGEDSGVHMECVYAIVVPHFTVRNSTFRDCSVMDLFFTYGTWWSPLPPPYGNVTVENNVFHHPERMSNGGWHYYGLYVGMTANGGGTVRRLGRAQQHLRERRPGRGAVGVRLALGRQRRHVGLRRRRRRTSATSASDAAPATRRSRRRARPQSRPRVPLGQSGGRATSGSAPARPAINAADPQDAPARDRAGLVRDAKPDAGAHEFGAKPPSVGTVRACDDPGGGAGAGRRPTGRAHRPAQPRQDLQARPPRLPRTRHLPAHHERGHEGRGAAS